MSTSISSVNAGSSAAANDTNVKKSSLSESTKSKLEALGITATDDMTESEALSLISAAMQEKQSSSDQQDGRNDSEIQILSEAKALASSVGVSISSDDTTEILNAIGNELETLLEDAENNPRILPQLSSYLSQLSSLDSRYDTLLDSQESIYSAMNMISTNNKVSHGLA